MSYQVGLSASEDDLEVQGEIDFDFFDNDTQNNRNQQLENNFNSHDESKINGNVASEIFVSDRTTGAVRKTNIETVIPTPESYKGNNCGSLPSSQVEKLSSPMGKQCNTRVDDLSDDSSVSSSLSRSDLSSSLSDLSLDNDDEQSDSMTDVTPLPSNCSSPIVKLDGKLVAKNIVLHNHLSVATPSLSKNVCQKKDVKFSDGITEKINISRNDNIDVSKLITAVKTLELTQSPDKIKKPTTPFLNSNSKNRRNITFANEEVRKIDQENQRLLKKIIVHQNRTKPHFTAVYSRPASSAINRQKQQRQIELDNLALLKRLEATRPSKDLSRLKLLNEYENRSSTSSRASMRPVSRTSSQLSSCRSSARSCGRSTLLNSSATGRLIKTQLKGCLTPQKSHPDNIDDFKGNNPTLQ